MLMRILNDIPRQLTVAFVLPLPILRTLHEDRPVISRQLFEVLQLSGTAVAVRGIGSHCRLPHHEQQAFIDFAHFLLVQAFLLTEMSLPASQQAHEGLIRLFSQRRLHLRDIRVGPLHGILARPLQMLIIEDRSIRMIEAARERLLRLRIAVRYPVEIGEPVADAEHQINIDEPLESGSDHLNLLIDPGQ